MMESIDIAIFRRNVSIHHWVQCWLTHPFNIVLEGREDGRKMKRQDVITMAMRLKRKRAERNHIAYFLKGPFLQLVSLLLGILSGFPRPTMDVDFVGKTWWCGNSFAVVFLFSRRSQIIWLLQHHPSNFFISPNDRDNNIFSNRYRTQKQKLINLSLPPFPSLWLAPPHRNCFCGHPLLANSITSEGRKELLLLLFRKRWLSMFKQR